MSTSKKIRVRACSIICNKHPEWGTWAVDEDRDGYFEIRSARGTRILDKWEADKFWSVVKSEVQS